MVHLTILAPTMTRQAPHRAKAIQAKRLDSWIQNSYVAARHDPDNSNRRIASDLPNGVVLLRSCVRSRDCLDPHMSSVNASADGFSHARRAAAACAFDPDPVLPNAMPDALRVSRPRIRIARSDRT